MTDYQALYVGDNIPAEEQTALLPERRIPSTSASLFSQIKESQFVSLIPCLVVGLAIWFGVSPSEELSVTAIHLLAVFASCIVALMTSSLDISVIILTGLVMLSVTQSFQCTDQITGERIECRLCGTVDAASRHIMDCDGSKEAFSHSLDGFSSTVVWLIFAAFHLGKAVETTGLGRRMSLHMVALFGQRIIGLAYAIIVSEILLAPFVPSNTARGGGIILPVVQSIASILGSTPNKNAQVGGYLMQVGAQANLLSASMFLTGMAANPIVIAKAIDVFPDMKFNLLTWTVGSIVPSLVCAVCIPWILAWACGLWSSPATEQKTTSDKIVKHAKDELHHMGHMSSKEVQLCLVLLSCLVFWVTSGYTSLDATLVALLGLMTLLHLGTITWKDISNNTPAWDTLFWLGGFVTIAKQLSEAGATAFIGHRISWAIKDLSLPALPCLAVAYFLTTFMFSSLSAHIVAFAATFLDAGLALHANPMMLTGLLAYFGALGGCLTNFSTGSVAMYFAPGYVRRSTWFFNGMIFGVFYILVYLTIGIGWWTLLGWH